MTEPIAIEVEKNRQKMRKESLSKMEQRLNLAHLYQPQSYSTERSIHEEVEAQLRKQIAKTASPNKRPKIMINTGDVTKAAFPNFVGNMPDLDKEGICMRGKLTSKNKAANEEASLRITKGNFKKI